MAAKLRFVFSQRSDPLEALELADGLLDPGSASVERPWEEAGLFLVIGLGRDDGDRAVLAGSPPVGLAGVALVADAGAGIHVRPEVEQDGKVRSVAVLAAGQIESNRMAVEIGLQMDLGGEATARAAERLAVLPPFAPAAETCARTTVLSNIWTMSAEEESAARCSKKTSKTPALLKRSNRFQTVFHLPNCSGSALQVTLWTEK